MRFELQSFDETMVPPTRELDGREEWAEISRNRLFQANSTRTGWWRSVVTATSLVTAHAIAGVAWSAVVMYPNLLSPPSNQFDDDESADDLSFVEPANDRLMSRDAVMQSRIVHSEEGPLITNGLVTFENPGRPETARSGFHGFQTWLISMPARLWTRMAHVHRDRRAVAELQALDDRMLKDIGISRGQILSVVRNGSRWV
jgi:uncharacterized protein YjiS (DUF1127 family)